MARFHYSCAMRWADMDAQGHVNNTEIVAYIEQARVSAFFDPEARALGRGVVVAKHQLEYLKPIVYRPIPLDIQLWVNEVRGASFLVHCEIWDGGALAARTLSTIVTVDLSTGRPRRLNPDERDLLGLYLDVEDHADALDEPMVAHRPIGLIR
ncbi:MAG: thioesterase [Pseudonocardiales bacterium]|nr:thioesterase [Pseudonocardiales bacterium]